MRWTACLVWLSWFSIASVAQGDVFNYFRVDGGLAETEDSLPEDLGRADALVWQTDLDSGHSTPLIHGESIYLTTFNESRQELATVALDRNTGQQQWKRVAPTERIEPVHRVGNPASATPACDGERLYVFFGSYGLLCYDLEGSLLWSRPLGPFQDEFGSSSSPVLLQNLVILNEDHDTDNYLYAFDAETGESKWQVPRNEFTRSYSTPLVFRHNGKSQIVVAGALTLTGYDAESGQRLWWIHGLARIVNPTPTYHDGVLYVASWSPGGDVGERVSMEPWDDAQAAFDRNQDNLIRLDELPDDSPVVPRFFRIDVNQDQGLDQAEWEKHAQVFERAENRILAIRPDGRGELGDEHVLWTYAKGVPYVASPVYYDGILYLVKDGGIFTSLDARTGEVLKQGRLKGRGSYYSSPVVADNKVYTASEQGVVSILSAERKWNILSSHDFGQRIYATPIVDGNRIYVRTEAALHCFSNPSP